MYEFSFKLLKVPPFAGMKAYMFSTHTSTMFFKNFMIVVSAHFEVKTWQLEIVATQSNESKLMNKKFCNNNNH